MRRVKKLIISVIAILVVILLCFFAACHINNFNPFGDRNMLGLAINTVILFFKILFYSLAVLILSCTFILVFNKKLYERLMFFYIFSIIILIVILIVEQDILFQ